MDEIKPPDDADRRRRDLADAEKYWSLPKVDIEQIIDLGDILRERTPMFEGFTTSECIAACTNPQLRWMMIKLAEDYLRRGYKPITILNIDILRRFVVAHPEILEIRRLWGSYCKPDFLDVEEVAQRRVKIDEIIER